MLSVHGHQHSFSTHERISGESLNVFMTDNVSAPGGTRTPNLRTHAECSNRHYLSRIQWSIDRHIYISLDWCHLREILCHGNEFTRRVWCITYELGPSLPRNSSDRQSRGIWSLALTWMTHLLLQSFNQSAQNVFHSYTLGPNFNLNTWTMALTD